MEHFAVLKAYLTCKDIVLKARPLTLRLAAIVFCLIAWLAILFWVL